MLTKIETLKTNKSVIYSLQILSLACLIFTIQLWQLHGFDILSMVPFIVGIGLSVLCSSCTMKRSINCLHLRNIVYGFVLEIFALIIFFGAVYKNIDSFGVLSLLQKIFFVELCISLIGLVFLQAYQLGYAVPSFHLKKMDKSSLFITILCICFLFGIGRWILNTWPRWDSCIYYFDIEKKINILNIFGINGNKLIICGHPISAFALLIMLFRNIPKISLINSIYLSNIFLLIINYFVVFQILRKTFKGKTYYLYSVTAFAFICSPYILGSVFTINPEHLALTGILLFLLGAIQSDYYLCILSCYIVCNARESHVPIIAILIVTQFLYDAYRQYREKHNFYSIEWVYYGIVFVIGLIWFMEFLSGNWASNSYAKGKYTYSSGNPLFVYRIDYTYIENQLKGIFLTNFSWVCVFIFIICFLLLIKDKKQRILTLLIENQLCGMLLTGTVVALFVACIFLTHHQCRYYTMITSMLYMLSLYLLIYVMLHINLKTKLKSIPIVILGIVMLAQCFVTWDPIMLAVFPTISTGKGKIAYMPWNLNNLDGPKVMDNGNYNFQILTFDKALNRVYEDTELRNGQLLLYDGYQWGDLGNTLNTVWGHGYEYMKPPAWGVWNETGNYRELSHNPNPEDIILPIPIDDFQSVDEKLLEYGKVYYLEVPWDDIFVEELKTHYPTMQLYKTVEYQTWRINVYSIH